MADIFKELATKIVNKQIKIVFPEGEDPRIIQAAGKLLKENLVVPILLGNQKKIEAAAEKIKVNLKDIQIIDPKKYPSDQYDLMVDRFVERRNGKSDLKQAESLLRDVNYFGTMMVYLDIADGMVSGATHPTGDTVRPALQIIKPAKGMNRISGAFIMQRDKLRYLFADAAINIDIDAPIMADIAVQSAQTAKDFDIDPKIAMLSFSTKGSAKHQLADKVIEATEIVKKNYPKLKIDGELQFDAAIDQAVGKSKAPKSKVAGQANVFIFPSLEAGNIGYKIAQRLGGFEAIGPVLQGLAKPVSDLSRGANADDVYKVSIITAVQAMSNQK